MRARWGVHNLCQYYCEVPWISRPEIASVCYSLTTEPASWLSDKVQADQPVHYLLRQSTKFPGLPFFFESSQSCLFGAVFTGGKRARRQIQGALRPVPFSPVLTCV